VLEDGSRQLGGTALYSGLQAARLGLRTLIVTRGSPREIDEGLGALASELDLRIEPAAQTTTLSTHGTGAGRGQRMLAWAGTIEEPRDGRGTEILHLAPVARELRFDWDPEGGLVGITPQGLVRRWSGIGAPLTLSPSPPAALRLVRRAGAIVLSELELEACGKLVQSGLREGAVVAVTASERPVSLLSGTAPAQSIDVPPLGDPRDETGVGEDLGAGDVFAAALFVSLAGGSPPAAAVGFAAAAAAVRMRGGGPGPAAVGDRAAIERVADELAQGAGGV
jgi:sugar/nucleoside kinase (ribokinase family)